MEIIVPAAGLSSRFPGMRPKYLLYDYAHRLMIYRALEPYLNYSITIGVLKEHDEKYHAVEALKHEFKNVSCDIKIVVLEKPTNGPADTVYQIIKKTNYIGPSSPFMIKDCDSFFEHEVTTGSYICVTDIAHHDVIKRLSAKSFVVSNDQGIITNIVEKKVVSNKFCVGAYKFVSAGEYVKSFEHISSEKEIFVSDVISVMLQQGVVFTEKETKNYIDVGTSEEWFDYNDRPVIFCDIDGTIIINQGRVGENNYESVPIILQKNINRLLQLEKNGAQIIFTTARTKELHSKTENMLINLGFKKHQLITGLQNSRRILINDFNKTNPFPRATAINIPRNSDTLEDFL